MGAASFNDSAWPSGAANLGFKNTNTTTIPSTTGRVTYYFRTSVTIAPGAPLQSAELSLIRDDGAVVHVNAVEVARSNMPTGAISFTTKAASVADGTGETTAGVLSIPTSTLSVGTNTIAIEVHQKSTGTAADVSLDARLDVTR